MARRCPNCKIRMSESIIHMDKRPIAYYCSECKMIYQNKKVIDVIKDNSNNPVRKVKRGCL